MYFLFLGRASTVPVPVWVRGLLVSRVRVWERRWEGIIHGSYATCLEELRRGSLKRTGVYPHPIYIGDLGLDVINRWFEEYIQYS